MAPLGSLYVLVKEMHERNCMNKCRCMSVWLSVCVSVCLCTVVCVCVWYIGLHRTLVYCIIMHVEPA